MQIDLGRGPSFPLRIGADGRLAWSHGDENVRESLRILLTTTPGERVMREQFGSRLRRLLAEPNTPTTRRLIESTVSSAIARWEPRVALESVRVDPDAGEPRRVLVTVTYRLVATGAVMALELNLESEV